MKKLLVTLAFACCIGTALFMNSQSKTNETGSPVSAGAETLTAAEIEPEDVPEAEREEVQPLTLEDIRTVTFSDVSQDAPAVDCISYAVHENILSGIDSECFCPDDWVTLASVLTALHRMSGEPAPAYEGTFPDVPAGSWYTDAVSWAYNAGIVAGGNDGRLNALEPVTRTRLAVLLYRFTGFEDDRTYDEQLSAYTDGADVPDYACLPMAWTLENRLFSGMVSNTIHPGLPVTRAQLAQVLTALSAYQKEEPVAMTLTTQMSAKIAVSSSQDNHDDIQLLIDKTASKYGAVGLQAAVVENGRVTDCYTYGWATKDSAVMTPEYKIRVASISKVAVGIAAMLLREEGVIDLDQDIGSYWGVRIKNPKYPDTPITIRSLLSHTSSICDYSNASRNYNAVKSTLSSSTCFTSGKPGAISSWGYNNYGFAVLGMTLELAADKYLDTILNEKLWNIMEIDASFDGGCIENTDLLTTLYYHDGSVGSSVSKQKTFVRGDYPGQTGVSFAGGLTISAADLGKVITLLVNDGCYEGMRLMEAESVELMETRNETQLSDGTYQALPLRSQDHIYGRDRLYYHTGSAYGVYNFFSYDPFAGDGVVVLTVGASAAKDSRGIYAVCGEISDYIYKVIQ